MGRYLLKFTKEGNIRYISHLDLLRVFQRAMKRAGISLRYSQGFNPHAKISFAHPLSLGYSSTENIWNLRRPTEKPQRRSCMR